MVMAMAAATILFVDDEPNVTQALRRALGQEPYEILTANSATEALDIMADQTVDVVVSDERMPGMCGSVFLGMVRESWPDTVRIILSGQAELEDVARAVNKGEIYRFCLKPINTLDLGVTIRQALQQRRLLQQTRRLLREFQENSTLADELDRLQPGITQVETDADGAIALDDTSTIGMDTLIREIDAALKNDR